MPNGRPKDLKSFDQLRQSISPILGDNERIPWTWYHRQSYTSGTTTQMIFFQATGGITTTNMQAAGQIPAPMFFTVYHIGVYFDLPVSNAAVVASNTGAGALNDTVNLLDGVLSFKIAQKSYFESLIWELPPGAGAYGNLAISATYTATDGDQQQNATNGVPDLRNRYMFWGDIIIPHNQNFAVQLDWASAVTLNNGNTDIIVYLDGFLHRRIL